MPSSAASPAVQPSVVAPRSTQEAMYSNVGRPPRSFVTFGVGGRCCLCKLPSPSASYASNRSQGQCASTFITDVASLPKAMQQSGVPDSTAPPVSGKRDSRSSSFRAKDAHLVSAMFRDWPGPMSLTTPAGKSIAAATDARAKACEAAGQPAHALMWRVLGVMAKHKGAAVDGAVKGAQPEAEILQLLSGALDHMGSVSPAGEEVTQRINAWVAHDASTASVRSIEDLLVSGKRSDALEAAKAARVRHQLIDFLVCGSVGFL